MGSVMICSFLMVLLFSFGAAKICPGGGHECPRTLFSESTCCQVPDGSYGCCPLPNAVCCDDHIHCCSQGSICKGRGNCEKGDQYVLSANQSVMLNAEIVCPDKEHRCEDNSTCCLMSETQEYGCCPLPNAVCCSDGIHCCPQDTTCDMAHQRCARKSENSVLEKSDRLRTMTLKEAERLLGVLCPGGEYKCPDGTTCCQLPSGRWGCCPFTKATCCPDKLHCCPEGMKCDTTSSSCHQGMKNVTWHENKPAAVVLKSKYIICPGGTYKCPDNTTCCQSPSGWGCCPYADAVCCSDHKHCCPAGYQCDVVSQQCIRGLQGISWLKKLPAKTIF